MSRSTELFDSSCGSMNLWIDEEVAPEGTDRICAQASGLVAGFCRIARRSEIGRGSSSLVPTGAVTWWQVVEGGSALTAKRSVGAQASGCKRRVPAAPCASESVCGMSSTGPCDAEPRRPGRHSIQAALTVKVVNQPLIISVL